MRAKVKTCGSGTIVYPLRNGSEGGSEARREARATRLMRRAIRLGQALLRPERAEDEEALFEEISKEDLEIMRRDPGFKGDTKEMLGLKKDRTDDYKFTDLELGAFGCVDDGE